MLNINSEVRLSPQDATKAALLTVRSLSSIELQWQPCGPDSDEESPVADDSA